MRGTLMLSSMPKQYLARMKRDRGMLFRNDNAEYGLILYMKKLF